VNYPSCGELIGTLTTPKPKLLRWRLIPVALLSIFGILTVFSGLFILIVKFFDSFVFDRLSRSQQIFPEIRIVVGWILLISARWCWQGLWGRAFFATIAACCAAAILAFLMS